MVNEFRKHPFVQLFSQPVKDFCSKIKRFVFFLLIIIFSIISCDEPSDTEQYQREVMVYGYLWGNRFLTRDHAIWISWTMPLFDYYDPDSAAISNAIVVITDSTTSTSYTLIEDSTRHGFYYNNALYIYPEHVYLLHVEVSGKIIKARTQVPPSLEIITDLNPDGINTFPPQKLSQKYPILLQCSNPDQIILVDMYCNENWYNAEYINPFGSDPHPQSREEYDGGVDGPPRHLTAAVRYSELPLVEGSLYRIIDWYSSMIVFYGSNTMKVLAIDENYINYLFSEYPVYNGGVIGGLGLFASVTGQKYHLNIVKP